MKFLLFASSILSFSIPNFIQYWDQNIKVDISTEAVVIPLNETNYLLSANNYKEDYCQDVFLDGNCTVSEGCVGRKLVESKSSGDTTLTSILGTLTQGIINNLIEKTGDKFYIKTYRVNIGLICVPAAKYYWLPDINEGFIVPRFIQARVDVGPMYHYFEVEFKSSKRIPSKYTEQNIQNSFSNDYGKGNMVYTIRDFMMGESQPSSPKLTFQQ